LVAPDHRPVLKQVKALAELAFDGSFTFFPNTAVVQIPRGLSCMRLTWFEKQLDHINDNV
jgi:hypothetical protein